MTLRAGPQTGALRTTGPGSMIAAGAPTGEPRGARREMAATPSADPTKTLPTDLPPVEHTDGLQVDVTGDDDVDKTLAAIEMAGEEVAAGWKPTPHRPLAPE